MKALLLPLVLLFVLALNTQAQSAPDPFGSLSFLLGNWEAKTVNTSGVTAAGSYTFQLELKNHVLARHITSNAPACKGPVDFDCTHGDLLYIYADRSGLPLRAIYFDNEGDVIHYTVTEPTPTSAEFLSHPGLPGPQFRLFYELKANTVSGKFQMRMPGQQDCKSYLEWTGVRKP